ncbi:GntR family transcriptional regulator [Priestia megaterium]|jgi:DNA-binding GntR family transcriptional regulator|uniref:GntR family transcriptional regulator n=1 Tax=Priestia megaterium TaxID=1404 RepID=UPI002E2433ED|nr:GntR family transcriptional regulator [Priestia megaterium]MED4278644.1 GntR family transcriptional regulator [Priestia megaterium]MED4292667.1 GntR family transcriptional regulator [Priestia megaterium]MED4298718.1 GntR family transcriptional regulator [Priestia megaterium]MED4319091.1 GntR family transcriptional regulator [Priestia megaterium]
MLRQDNRVPLYLQLKESLRSSIVSGNLKSGDKIPTELELSEKYNISRVTVRKAIIELVEEGYLIKKQGKGTFVNTRKIERKIVHFLSFSAACEANGVKASSKVIKKEIVPPQPRDRELLQLEDEDLLIHIQRVRYADERPLMVENNYFSYKKYSFLLEEKMDRSLYKLLREKYNIDPNNPGETSLEIVRALDDEAKLLEVANGEPLFFMKTLIYNNQSPVHIGKQYILGEGYKFML